MTQHEIENLGGLLRELMTRALAPLEQRLELLEAAFDAEQRVRDAGMPALALVEETRRMLGRVEAALGQLETSQSPGRPN